MILFKKADALTKYLRTKSEKGLITGFVPTMGALHDGHIQLVSECRTGCDVCIVSIFVNPTQFNDPGDFTKYPVTIDKDIIALERAGCDVLFLPDVQEIYPHGTGNLPHYALGFLETVLEGFYRPGHFQGVCQVMDRLLSIVMPGKLFMGKKDYQQCMVIQKLIGLKQWDIRLQWVPTVREASGLAMSSRNKRLTEIQRQQATAIYHALSQIRETLRPGSMGAYISHAAQQLLDAGFEAVDYISICHAHTLETVDIWNGQTPLVALAAAFIGGVRLIDNMPLTGV